MSSVYFYQKEGSFVNSLVERKATKLHHATFFLLEGPAADATDALQPWRLIVQGSFLHLHFNGVPVE
jgi:hypothetical protein